MYLCTDVVLRIGLVADLLPSTITTQESVTKPILKTTLPNGKVHIF